MDKTKELAQNTTIFAIGTFGAKLMQFFLVPLYTVYMSPADFSTSDLINTTVALLMPFFTLCAYHGVLRFVVGQEDNRKSVLKFSLIVCGISFGILLVMHPIFGEYEVFRGYEIFFPLLFIASALKQVLAQYCKAIDKNKYYAFDGIACAVTLAGFSILLIGVFNYGVKGYLLAYVLSNLLSILFFTLVCKIPHELKGAKLNKNLTKEFVKYSLPIIPNDVSWWIIQMLDRYMLVSMVGSAINGIYTIAYKIPGLFNMLVSIFMQAFAITAFKECDTGTLIDGKVDGGYFSKIYSKYIALTYLAALIVILVSKPVALLFIKKEFFLSWKYTPLLLIAFAVGNLQSFYGTVLRGVKKTIIPLIAVLVGAIVVAVLNYILIPLFSAYGAALATVISYLVIYVVHIIGTKKYVIMEHYIMKNVVSIIIISLISVLYIKMTFLTLIGCGILSCIIIAIYLKEYKELCKMTASMAKKIIFQKK